MSPKRSYCVFVSHSHGDRWIARQMCDILERSGKAAGITTFLDEKDIEGGESISGRILTQLTACEEFVVLLSPHSINRPWVLIEIGAAWGLKKRITPIVDKVSSKDVPEIIGALKYVELNDFDTFVQQVVKRAERLRDE